MIRFLTAILLISISGANHIEWDSKRKLKWSDFKGTPNVNSSFFAMTNSGIKYGWSSSFDGSKRTFEFVVSSYFDTDNSWVKKGKESDSLLMHEQIHFDISELKARDLRRRLNKFSYTKNYKFEIDSIFQKIRAEENETQELYDIESNHSLNKKEQEKWRVRIANTLLLSKYN